MQYPQVPASLQTVSATWMAIQNALPPGWRPCLESEYGDDAYWIARLAASPTAPFDGPEVTAATAQEALASLLLAIGEAHLVDVADDHWEVPAGSASADALAAAWGEASSRLPTGWWISSLDGYSAPHGATPGWIASAAGGAANGYDGRQGSGLTPEAALLALSAAFG